MLSITSPLILTFSHLLIIVLWALTNRGNNIDSIKKTWGRLRSIPIVMFEFLALIQIIFIPQLTFPLMTRSASLEFLGLCIAMIGTTIAVWAKLVMGKNWGSPAQHDKRKQSTLVTTGPFRYSRNPIYAGLFLLFLGQQIALQSYGILMTIIFAYAIYQAVKIEEPLLEKYFGKTYKTYKSRVPRFF